MGRPSPTESFSLDLEDGLVAISKVNAGYMIACVDKWINDDHDVDHLHLYTLDKEGKKVNTATHKYKDSVSDVVLLPIDGEKLMFLYGMLDDRREYVEVVMANAQGEVPKK